MVLERTLSIIKPDAVAKNVIGDIYSRFEKAGLKVVAAKYKQLSRREAEGFYAVHRDRPFFNALVEFMISGPVMIQVLESENAVARHRELLGATNPKDAALGTIRADFAESIEANAAHGSIRSRMLRLKWLTFSLLPKLFCDEIVGMNGFAVIPSVTTTTTSGGFHRWRCCS